MEINETDEDCEELQDLDAELKTARPDIGHALELVKNRVNFKEIIRCSNATPFRGLRAKGYACCYCPDTFPDPAALKNHNLASHDDTTKEKLMKEMKVYSVRLDVTGLECSICNSAMGNLEDLIDHLIDVHDKVMHKNIKNFLLPFKFDGDELRCALCSKYFVKFKSLLEHMNMHYRNFVCNVCDAGFVYRDILRHHSKSHEKGVFNCNVCSKQFDTHRKKKSHESAVHKRANMINKCGICDEKFISYEKKLKHMAKAHGTSMPVLECKACDKTFTSQNAYRIHLHRDHLMERNFKCDICDMSFYESDLLKNHMIKHTKERMHRCDVCLKSYGRKSTLQVHMRIHADDRRFKCDHCGMGFVQKCTLRTHMHNKHIVI